MVNGVDPGQIPSKRFAIWSRLYRRFLLEPTPATGSLSSVGVGIVPVTDVDALLHQPLAVNTTMDLSVTQGTFISIYAVPVNRRARVDFASIGSTTGTVFLICRIIVEGTAVDVSLSVPTASFHQYLGSPLTLNEGDSIGAAASGNGADNARVGGVLGIEEDAF